MAEVSLVKWSLHLSDDNSKLVHAMASCHQATSHYLSQCLPSSMSPYGVKIIYFKFQPHVWWVFGANWSLYREIHMHSGLKQVNTIQYMYYMAPYWTINLVKTPQITLSLQRHHNECDGISNHQPHYCLLNRLFRRKSKKTSKLRITGLCVGNSPVTGEFPA